MSIRGEYAIIGRGFCVADGNLFEVMADATNVSRGNIANDGQMTTIAANPQQLFVASGGSLYFLDLITNAFSQIPANTFDGPVAQIVVVGDFFLVSLKNSRKFYVSAPIDGTDWTTNGSALVEQFPDNIVSMTEDHGQVFFTSDTKSCWYFVSGDIFPFAFVQGSLINQGNAATFSPAQLDNTIFWLGSDERGRGKWYRANGYIPLRVSNHAIETAIQSYSRIDDVVSYSFQMGGHEFLRAYFPTPSKTWEYDVMTGMWHEVTSWDDTSGQPKAHRSQCHMFIFGKHLVGDWGSNKVYEMALPFQDSAGLWHFATDAGSLIHRLRRAPHISNEQQRQRHSKLQVFVETGIGPVPPLTGDLAGTNILMQDPSGLVWQIGISDVGVITADPLATGGMAQLLYLNDPDGVTSWKVTIDGVGDLNTTQVETNAYYPQTLTLANATQTIFWDIGISNLGVLTQDLAGSSVREPKMNLRWSSDGAHTWSNYHERGCGQLGEYRKRVIWRQLGMPRDRVYEISMSDPIGWRVIDAYLQSAQGLGS